MEKKQFLSKADIVAIVLIIAILAGMFIFYACDWIEVEPPDIEGRNKYILPTAITKALFFCTPEEFSSKSLAWYSNCEDYREHAKVYKGKLVLYLTEEQEKAMLDYYDSNIEAFEEVKGVDISDDYTSYTFTGPREDIKNMLIDIYKKYPKAHDNFKLMLTNLDKLVLWDKINKEDE